jgi:hypothetical protein
VAKTQAVTNISPLEYSFQRPILSNGSAGVRTISQLANWLRGFRQQVHLATATGPDGWDGGSARGTMNVVASSTQKTFIHTDFWFSREAAQGTGKFGFECFCESGNEVTITYSITGALGTVNGTLVFTNGDNTNEKRSAALALSTATAGDEFCEVVITVQRTLGAATTNKVLEATFEEDEITDPATLPDPLND